MLIPRNDFSKVKDKNDWLDNYIEHLIDTNNKILSIKVEKAKYNPNQLDWEHCHSWFNYYEDDGPKFAIGPSNAQISIFRSRPSLPIYLDDPKHN